MTLRQAKRARGRAILGRLRSRLTAGLAVVERGGRYCEAAEAAGYSDPFVFSRTCRVRLGARPRDVVRNPHWRELVCERTERLYGVAA